MGKPFEVTECARPSTMTCDSCRTTRCTALLQRKTSFRCRLLGPTLRNLGATSLCAFAIYGRGLLVALAALWISLFSVAARAPAPEAPCVAFAFRIGQGLDSGQHITLTVPAPDVKAVLPKDCPPIPERCCCQPTCAGIFLPYIYRGLQPFQLKVL